MIPKQAIEKAVEGGWQQWANGTSPSGEDLAASIDNAIFDWPITALDPTFWQALGKTLGWEKKMVVRRGMVIGNFGWESPDKNIRFYGEEMGAGMDYMNPWVYYAHRFYDLILTGGDTDKFWQEILPTK